MAFLFIFVTFLEVSQSRLFPVAFMFIHYTPQRVAYSQGFLFFLQTITVWSALAENADLTSGLNGQMRFEGRKSPT